MKLIISLPVFCLVSHLTLSLSVADDHQNTAGLRRNKVCPEGYGGVNCRDDIDECKASPYPCAGGDKKATFCVDYDPPLKFKCGCLLGYNAVLPNASDIKDNVPPDWRPLKCVPKDVCVGVVCHEDASCKVSSNNLPVCICNDNLVGDGITSCSPPPRTVPAKKPPSVCTSDSYCRLKLQNSLCIAGTCTCKKGFYLSNGKGQCISENQCANGFPNDCHKNAVCTNTEGGYFCTCKDGYQDLSTNVKPGTVCAQTNECLTPSMNNCNTETQVCLDRPPPKKWECVDRTPAPTPSPTLSPQDLDCQMKGFQSVGLCIACTFLKFTSSDCQFQTQGALPSTGFVGRIPSQIGLLTNLNSLYIVNAECSGTIPTEIGKLINLSSLILGNSKLTGKIPTEIGNLIKLSILVLGNSKLTGPIPTELGNLSSLNMLFLNNNGLTGPIPTVLGNLSSLMFLILNDNGLTQPPPAEITTFCNTNSRMCQF